MKPNVIVKSDLTDLVSDQNYNLWLLFLSTRDTLAMVRAKDLHECGLSNIETAVLLVVQLIEQAKDVQATPAKIAEWLFRKPNSISGLVARMEKRGLVQRVNDLNQKNQVRVALTAKGRQAFECSTDRTHISRILSSLSPKQRQEFWSTLSLLRDRALDDLNTKRKAPFPHLRV